jgi:hypothetical protein
MLCVVVFLGFALAPSSAMPTQSDSGVGAAAQRPQATPVVVKTVSFVGSTGVPQSEQDQFAKELEGKRYPSNSDLTQKVLSFWQEFGFWTVRVKSEQRDTSSVDRRDINLVFRIDEGNQYRLKELRSSATVTIATDLEAMFQMKPGDVVDKTKIRRGIGLLRGAYADRGYSRATVIPQMQFDHTEHTIRLLVDVTPGAKHAMDAYAAECKSVLAHPPQGPPLAPSFAPVLTYDPRRDAVQDVQNAIQEAHRTRRNVLLVVGGEWCAWCHILDRMFQEHARVVQVRDENFVTVFVNDSEENKNEELLSRLPSMSDAPHLFVLDQHGNLLVSQTASELEESRGYSDKRVEDFLRKWSTRKSPIKCVDVSSQPRP